MSLRGKGIGGKLALLSLLAAMASSAAWRTSVEDLKGVIGDAAAKHSSDKNTAFRIAKLELTERITEDTLAALQSRSPGPETAATLAALADQSAFLEPPAAERSPAGAPSIAQQRLIFDRATNYTVAYAKRLPNLICTETIRRFDDAPNTNTRAASLGDLHHRDTIVAQLTYSMGQQEATLIKSVNGSRAASSASLPGVSTSGEFGGIMIALFFPDSHTKAIWSHWEVLHGHRVAVFRYSVSTENSRYQLSYCCEGKKVAKSIVAGYRGFIFIDPETGTIVRITRTSMGVPPDFLMHQVDTEVEYGPRTIGETTLQCPIRSVTKAESTPLGGPSGSTTRLHSLNETRFTDYRKFEAEGRLIATAEPEVASLPAAASLSTVNAQPDSPPQPSSISEPPPVLEAQADDTHHSLPPDSSFSPPPPPAFQDPPPSESKVPVGATPTFREQLRLVRVPVVVRSRKGEAVPGLTQSEFELFDNGKRQTISNFVVQGATQGGVETQTGVAKREPAANAVDKPILTLPERYVAYVFDDIHIALGDLSQTRSAEKRLLNELLQPDTRVAIFTTSAQTTLDFTADRQKVIAVLDRIAPHPKSAPHMDCPDVGYYQADLIVNKGDTRATEAAAAEAIERCGVDPSAPRVATNIAMASARHSLAIHDYEARAALDALRVVVRRMAALPGERGIVLVSPGFFMSTGLPGMEAIVDRAVRGGIVINTLDARGLYTSADFNTDQQEAPNGYRREEQREQSAVLAQLSDATGGRIFENSNDYDAGFRALAKRPEISYLLGFSPKDEKSDGSYHHLKVKVKAGKGLEVQARRGYVDSKQEDNPAQAIKEEIESALFSRDEMRQIPLTVKILLGPDDGTNAQMSVSTHVDIGQVPMQKVNGRFQSKLSVTFGFFDRDGKMVTALNQAFPLDISESDLPSRLKAGVDLKSDLKAGVSSRFLRVVLRDDEGRMSTVNEVLFQ